MRNLTVKELLLLLFLLGGIEIPQYSWGQVSGKKDPAQINGVLKYPVYVFCGTGDNLWVYDKEPVDSRETIDAMFDWMSQTYQMKRMYWRGGQEDMWQRHFHMGKETVMNYDYDMNWAHHVYRELGVSSAAVRAAKRTGSEIFLYTGLFEHGVQPDVGIIGPHLFEDTLRIKHPEWITTDRWGTRRAAGPIDFCYPEARKIIVKRYADQMIKDGYDGINFYTYVENTGLRYQDEFGFNQPIADEFNKRYPGVDLRNDRLTDEQRLYWYRCRGKFVTDFLRELKTEIAPHGKKISMILDAVEPDYAQRWWGKALPGTGMIYLDWKQWIKEGLVDEFWVQLGPAEAQKKTLDSLLLACAGTPIRLTVRTPDPYAPYWLPYVKAGVTPVAVITWLNNGIEKYSFASTSVKTLGHPDWKVRLQSLDDIVRKKFTTGAKQIAPLIKDENVLVRRKAMHALVAVNDPSGILLIEEGLEDSESSVRTAAAVALKSLHRPGSVDQLIASLSRQADFPFKTAAGEAFAAMGPSILPALYKALENAQYGVGEAVIRGISNIGEAHFDSRIFNELLQITRDVNADYRLRWWSMKGVKAMLPHASPLQLDSVWQILLAILKGNEPTALQLEAALTVEKSTDYLSAANSRQIRVALVQLFKTFGDKTTRPDAAFGWRPIGNALKSLGIEGINALEDFRKQQSDKWLAWLAYEVLYLEQRKVTVDGGFNLITEEEAIRNQKMFAPEFPGWRKY